MAATALKTTPLHEWHERHGARMVEFGGWEMPVQYSGIVEEHRAVRRRAGLFDVSHMGEIRIRGSAALDLVQRLTVNDASSLVDGKAQYTVMCDDEGGVVDDLLVYRLGEEDYLLVVNAATTDKDLEWIRRHTGDGATVDDESGRWAQLALQGPESPAILQRVLDVDVEGLRPFRFVRARFQEEDALVSRTGYTGEDGFEIYLSGEQAPPLADALMETGEPAGLAAAGLGARDTLRLEAGLLLYGNDMDESTTPVEAGLDWVVKPGKGDFLGREVLVRQLQQGIERRLVGFGLTERGVPRHGYPIHAPDGEGRGEVTSGTYSPTLERGIGMGYVDAGETEPGTELAIAVRGRMLAAEIVELPFYRRSR